MIKSMTGYGRGTSEAGGRIFTVEIKTVNHRYLEPSIRLPRKLFALEGELRALLKERILVVPGKGFGFGGYVRLSCSVDERIIERSAAGFKRAMESFSR